MPKVSRLEAVEKEVAKMRKEQRKLIRILEKDRTVEKKEISEELSKIEMLERGIKEELTVHPLKKVTHRDVTKGILGAFFGVVGHFSFAEGARIAKDLTLDRSILLLTSSFILITLLLYFAGFKKVRDEFFMKVLPIRAIVIYFSAIITTIAVLFLYGEVNTATPLTIIFNDVAAISVLASLGAGTADLLGKNE